LDDQNLNTFKQNARKQAEKFSLEQILPLYEEIYSKLVQD
jgi:hypothetical protein